MISKQVRILITFAIVTLFFVLLLGINAYNIARDQVILNHERALTELANAVEAMIRTQWIQPRESLVNKLAASPVLLGQFDGTFGRDDLIAEWLPVYDLREDIFFIYYANLAGSVEMYPRGELPEDFDALTRPWYAKAIQNPGVVSWSDPYEEVITKEIVISTVKTIHHSLTNEILGVFSIDLTTDEMAGVLSAIQLPEGSAAYVFNGAGHLLASTNYHQDQQSLLGQTVSTNEPGQSSYYGSENNEDLFVNQTQVAGMDWSLLFVVPRKSMLERIIPIRNRGFLGAAIFIVTAALFLMYYLYYVRRKVDILAKYFLEMSEGTQDVRNLFREKDEFTVLNREFNETILRRRQAEELRKKTEKKYAELVRNAPLGIYQSTPEGRFVSVNNKLAELTGYPSPEEMINSITDLETQFYDNSQDRQVYLDILDKKGYVSDYHVKLLRRDGTSFWGSNTSRKSADKEGNTYIIDGFITDITERIEARARLEELVNTDDLTNIGNRRHFLKQTENELKRLKRYDGHLSLVYIDIDQFKTINDKYGHHCGDQVLVEFSRKLSELKREIDILGRIGGEEFAITMPNTKMEDALIAAERIRQAISDKLAVKTESGNVVVTASFGVTSLEDPAETLETLMQKADTALYAAKAAGRNRVCG